MISHTVKHSLGLQGAKDACENAFAQYSRRFPKAQLERTWVLQSDHRIVGSLSFVVMGRKRTCAVTLTEIDATVDSSDLPSFMVGVAKGLIDQEVKAWVRPPSSHPGPR